MSYYIRSESGGVFFGSTYVVGNDQDGVWVEYARFSSEAEAEAKVNMLNGGNYGASRDAVEQQERAERERREADKRLQRERQQAIDREARKQAQSAAAWQQAQASAVDQRLAAEAEARRKQVHEEAELRRQYPPERQVVEGGLAAWGGAIKWFAPGNQEAVMIPIEYL